MFCTPAFNYFIGRLASDPCDYLEIGVYDGDSVLKLAEKYPQKTIYAIDPFIEDGNTSHHSLRRQGEKLERQRDLFYANNRFTNIAFYEMTSKDFLQKIKNGEITGLNIGSILIDGSHHYDDILIDIEIALLLLKGKEGAVIFDDTNIPDVGKAISEFQFWYHNFIKETINLHPHIVLFKTKFNDAFCMPIMV